MKTKFLLILLVIFLSLGTLSFSQQPAGAKAWFSPQKATAYKVAKTYSLVPAPQDPPMPTISDPILLTTNYVINPPLSFHADTLQATRLMQFKVTLTYDSRELTLEPADFSCPLTGIYLTATVVQPGTVEVQGITYLDAGSPLAADKCLFKLSLPAQALPAEPVSVQAKVNTLLVDSAAPYLSGETVTATVNAIAKSTTEVISFGDENRDGNININDALLKSREISGSIITAGTVFAYNLGDFNLDGIVSILDALLVAQYSANLTLQITNYNPLLADVDFNNKTDIIDALLITSYSTGSRENF